MKILPMIDDEGPDSEESTGRWAGVASGGVAAA